MSEEILKVFLADLNPIRIKCIQCGLVLELDVSQVPLMLPASQFACQNTNCHASFMAPGKASPQPSSPLHQLAFAMQQLQAMKGTIEIEFPVKIK